MDVLDRLLGHDAWTTRELLLRSLHLTDDELDRDFDIGHRTLRLTFLHIIRNMEVWTDLIAGVSVREDAGRDASGRSIERLLETGRCRPTTAAGLTSDRRRRPAGRTVDRSP